MNGREAKHIRRTARAMCNPRLGIEVVNGQTVKWPAASYRGAIRELKKWRALVSRGMLPR